MNDILTMKNIQKSFGDLEVIKDISVSIKQGDVLSIIGPSGGGKSTLLRCAAMLETINGGSIAYGDKQAAWTDDNGKVVYAKGKQMKEIKNCFGLVFQNFNLFPHFSVLKNITDAPLRVQKRNKDEVMAEAEVLLDKMGLREKADAYPYQLSGGQQQRVAIARALALKPEILFFDEPTSALDPELTAEVLRVIRQLADEDMTMGIVTHEMNFARLVSDHLIFIDGGIIVEQGSPDEVLGNPKMERTKAFLNKLEQ